MNEPESVLSETRKLALADARLWTDPVEKYGFNTIWAQENPSVLSGHDFLTNVIDAYFENNTLTASPTDLSFLRAPNNLGEVDPRVTAFVAAHPEKLADLLEYCKTHAEVQQLTANVNRLAGTPNVSAAIIKAIDDREGKVSVDEIINDVFKNRVQEADIAGDSMQPLPLSDENRAGVQELNATVLAGSARERQLLAESKAWDPHRRAKELEQIDLFEAQMLYQNELTGQIKQASEILDSYGIQNNALDLTAEIRTKAYYNSTKMDTEFVEIRDKVQKARKIGSIIGVIAGGIGGFFASKALVGDRIQGPVKKTTTIGLGTVAATAATGIGGWMIGNLTVRGAALRKFDQVTQENSYDKIQGEKARTQALSDLLSQCLQTIGSVRQQQAQRAQSLPQIQMPSGAMTDATGDSLNSMLAAGNVRTL